MNNPNYIVEEFELDNSGNKIEDRKSTHSFEQTVRELGSGRFHLFILLICGSAYLSCVNEGLSIGFVLPYAKCDLEMTPQEQGFLNSAGLCGLIVSSHFWGFMADTWGRKKVMQASLSSAFIFSTASSFSNNVWLIIVLRFIVGLCISGVQSSGIAYLGEFHSDKTRSKHVTFAAMFSTISILYMSSIGWLIIPAEWQANIFGMIYRPWRLFIFASSCINLFALFGLLIMPESPKFLLAMGRGNEALDIIKSVYLVNTGYPKESFPVTEIAAEKLGSNLSDTRGLMGILALMWSQTKPLFQKPHAWNLFRMSYISFALFAVAHGFYMWYPEILSIYLKHMDPPTTVCGAINLNTISRNNNNSTVIAPASDSIAMLNDDCKVINSSTTYPIFLLMGTIYISLYMFAAFTMDRIGKRLLISSWLVLTCLGGIGLVFADSFYAIQTLVILFISSGNCGSIVTALSADLFPTCYKGMALCIIMISARLGAVFGNNLIAALLINGCDGIFYSFVALLGTCILVFITMSTKTTKN